jgi:2-oxoglutarate-Fe(II)-dependent oxygenase superfamily protein
MLDTDALAAWIQPHHLTQDSLARSRDAMASHPSRMVVLHDLLTEPVASRIAAFLADQALYTVERGLYSRHEGVDAEAWEAAPADDRFFRFGKLTGQRPEAMLSDTMLTYLQWRTFVTEPAFRGFFEALTGMSLGPSDDFGCHEFRVGDFLLAHDDANRNRRVALVLYLTPAWRPEFGGALSMTAADGSVDRVEASFNTMVVFDTLAGSSHHIERIEAAAGDQARRTFGGWFPNAP